MRENKLERVHVMDLLQANTQEERIAMLRDIVKPFDEVAAKHEAAGTFPFENFNALKEAKYPALTIPKEYGGAGISLVELLELQVIIAAADGSTGLGIGWHMGVCANIGISKAWDEAVYQKFARDVLENGALINNSASEPKSGSPSWGNRPLTIATKTEEGWIIDGRKNFTTLAPVLDYFVVSASIADSEDVGNFLVRRTCPGVAIEETWDSIAMAGTGSHDLVLDQVKVNEEDFVAYRHVGPPTAQGWLLHIPTAYLGIARAAHDEAVRFAVSYSPGSMEGTISDIPTVQARIGQMALKLRESETYLFSVARKWDESTAEVRKTMHADLAVAKLIVVNKANEIVDLAMRIVGARSLSAKNPLQRYYRNVRAGLHNPPMDDITMGQLAQASIKQFKTES